MAGREGVELDGHVFGRRRGTDRCRLRVVTSLEIEGAGIVEARVRGEGLTRAIDGSSYLVGRILQRVAELRAHRNSTDGSGYTSSATLVRIGHVQTDRAVRRVEQFT